MITLLEKLRDKLQAELAEATFYRRRSSADQSKEIGDPERDLERVSLDIYIGALPSRTEEDASLYPFIILQPVRIARTEQEGMPRQEGKIRLILGLAGEAPESGMIELIDLIQLVNLALSPETLLGSRYRLETGHAWTVGDPRDLKKNDILPPHYLAWAEMDWTWAGIEQVNTPAKEADTYGEGYQS